jgi:hypothetical protein
MQIWTQVPAAVEEMVGSKWEQDDVLPLNGTPEEVRQLREKMLLQRAALKAKKKEKKIGTLPAALKDDAAALSAAAVAGTSGTSNDIAVGGFLLRRWRCEGSGQLFMHPLWLNWLDNIDLCPCKAFSRSLLQI